MLHIRLTGERYPPARCCLRCQCRAITLPGLQNKQNKHGNAQPHFASHTKYTALHSSLLQYGPQRGTCTLLLMMPTPSKP